MKYIVSSTLGIEPWKYSSVFLDMVTLEQGVASATRNSYFHAGCFLLVPIMKEAILFRRRMLSVTLNGPLGLAARSEQTA